jgi:hypothetical protein
LSSMEQLLHPKRALMMFLHLMVLRRHCHLQTYDSMESHDELKQFCSSSFHVTWATTNGGKYTHSMPIMTILRSMKLNLEETDTCSVMAASVFAALRAQHSNVSNERPLHRLLQHACLAILFFGSRCFLKRLLDALKDTVAVSSADFGKVLRDLVRRHKPSPHRLFTTSFNPNRIRFFQVRRSKCRLTCMKKLWNSFARHKTKPLNLKSERRKLFCQLGRSMGAFTAKNYWQLLCKALPTSPVFKTGTRQRTCASAYTETGPGARTALNALNGVPRAFAINAPGQLAADAFNVFLVRWWKEWRNLCKEALKHVPDCLHQHLAYFANVNEVGFQFLLCEFSKVLNYVASEHIHYGRDFCWG